MPRKTKQHESAIEKFRGIVNWCSYWNEDWNMQWDAEQLTKLHAFAMSEQGGRIDETADRWPLRLVKAILALPVGGQLDAETFAWAKELEL